MKLIAAHGNRVFLVVGDCVVGLSVAPDAVSGEVAEYRTELGKGSQILAVTTNSSGTELYAIFDNKLVVAWDVANGSQLGSRVLKKRPTSLASVSFQQGDSLRAALLIADKFGDITGVRTPDLGAEILLGGHTASVVTDLLVTDDQQLVLTADRDEKFRVSSFPALETITSYALGHTSVVASLCSVALDGTRYIVSSSWDHSIMLWKYAVGAMSPICSYTCTEPKPSPSPSETMPTAPETEAPSGADEEGEGDLIPEKQFVESDAGHYPFKVVATKTESSVAIVAAIFRHESMVKLLRLEKDSLVELAQIDLPAPPADILFLDGSRLVVLGHSLPEHPMNAFRVFDLSWRGSLVIEETTSRIWTSEPTRADRLQRADIHFTQQLVAQSMGLEGDTGMRKHALDRPFNKDEDIDLTAKKGARRSRKRRAEGDI